MKIYRFLIYGDCSFSMKRTLQNVFIYLLLWDGQKKYGCILYVVLTYLCVP